MQFGYHHLAPNMAEQKRTGVRKIDYANSVVKKTIEITNYFEPRVFSPKNGTMPTFRQEI